MKAVVAIIVLACVLAGSDACSCMFRHVQDYFCSSDFVVKATIINGRNVYKNPSTTTPVTTPMTTPTQSSSPSSDTNNELLWGEEEEEEVPQEPVKRPPAGFLGGLLAPVGLSSFPGFGVKADKAEVELFPLRYEYTIQIEKIFKGHHLFTEKQKAIITTAPYESLCGLTGLTEGVSYLLTGNEIGDRLSIGLCSWVAPYSSLTRIQRRGVKMLYKQKCNECQINNCYGTACKYANPDNNTCMLNMSGMWDSCEVKYSHCSRNKNSCKWQRNRDYKQCLLGTDKTQERRPLMMP